MKYFFIYAVLLSIFACNNQSIYELETGKSYQYHYGSNGIVRLVRDTYHGRYSLQLFDNSGHAKDDIVMTSEKVFMAGSDEKSVNMIYVVDKIPSFPPWYKYNSFNPTNIGNYKVNYSYAREALIREPFIKLIDSFSVDREKKTVTFYKKKCIVEIMSVEKLVINKDRFEFYDTQKSVTTEFRTIDSTLVYKFISVLLRN